jgi:Sugar transferases involved in lipopolysaccharide synthesis
MRRLFDILISICLLILFSPVLFLLAIIIKFDSKGPVFFTQMRIGKENKLFKFYKFRTMAVGTPNVSTEELKNSQSYITPFGKILRKTSMDELPQLINIFKGDMTFIGPRPALYNQYELKEMRTKVGVHKLLPGLTGWAQVNGRDMLSDSMKTSYDEYYLINKSVRFNFKILVRTVFKVLRCDGVIEGGSKRVVEVEDRENVEA